MAVLSWEDERTHRAEPVAQGKGDITIANGNKIGTIKIGWNGFIRNILVVAPATSASTFDVIWLDDSDRERNRYATSLSDNGNREIAVDDWPVRYDHKLKLETDSAVGADETFNLDVLGY